MGIWPEGRPGIPLQYVVTRAGDAVYRGEDRVVIGVATPSTSTDSRVILGQSPGAIWRETLPEGNTLGIDGAM